MKNLLNTTQEKLDTGSFYSQNEFKNLFLTIALNDM